MSLLIIRVSTLRPRILLIKRVRQIFLMVTKCLNGTLLALISLNYKNLTVDHLSYFWTNLYKQSSGNFNSTKPLSFSFFCNNFYYCNCDCGKFKLWKLYTRLLTQDSLTKITLLLFF